jgi:hypothetical protein
MGKMSDEVIPVELRVQGMVCQLLQDTKARFEEVRGDLESWLEDNKKQLEEEKEVEFGNPAMYQRFIDSELEQLADFKQGIIGLTDLIGKAKALESDIASFWERQKVARHKRIKKGDFEETG